MLIVKLAFMLFAAQIGLAFIKGVKITFLLFVRLQLIFLYFLELTFQLKLVIAVAITKFEISVI